MRAALAVLVVLVPGVALGEACGGASIPGLAAVARELNVRPVVSTFTTLMDCNGRSYEIGALLGGAVAEIKKAQREAAEARREIGEMRARPAMQTNGSQ